MYGGDKEETKTQKVQRVIDKFSYCSYFECCSAKHIPYDIDGLKADFNEYLFGQHIANGTLIPALKSHVNNLEMSQKPLVMSFHGTPGTGKNFVADFIARRFYAAGDESSYVHRYRGRIDFPLDTQVPIYRVSNQNNHSKPKKKVKFLAHSKITCPESISEQHLQWKISISIENRISCVFL